MATPKKKKLPQVTRTGKLKRKKISDGKRGALMFLALLLLFVAGFIVYKQVVRHQAVNKEKTQFAQVEKDMNSLLKDVSNTLGPVIQPEISKSCSYTSSFNEFSPRGDLVCSIVLDFEAGANDKDSAISLVSKIKSSLGRNDFKIHSSSTLFADTLIPTELESNGSVNTKSGLNCISSYTLLASSKIHNSQLQLHTALGCNIRPAAGEYFPLEQ